MNHSTHIRSFVVNSQMHADLRRRAETSIGFQHLAFPVYLADILRRHKAFGNAGGGAEDLFLIELYGKISVVGRYIPRLYTRLPMSHINSLISCSVCIILFLL